MKNIALIGCGAIGSSVLELLSGDTRLQVGWVLVPEITPAVRETAARLAPQAQLLQALPGDAVPDLLVECAGHAAIEEHVLPALARGIPAVIASIGALSAPGMADRVQAAAEAGKTQAQLLSGAIGGIDALAAARVGGLETVLYTGRKPPKAWSGTPAEQVCDLEALTEAFCIFEGTAREAAQLYPKNANVAATLSLAGLGLDKTMVRLFADPAVQENVHQVEARGAFGAMELTMRGKPLAANPKTSALTVYSVVRAVLNNVASLAI
ncbi:aspartate dehydrogenase [Comamonas thiooxydans]|uniref:L-aspartate dehydrogenase n=1 Tax=Comamonas thiooxydans TaxID=363952 RepID=A0AA42TSQ5_9BURK|nr:MULTISPECIES: aspartate dehydrogenase [Comamonas]EFI63543.1 L-aspartate dehydrogenase [Comamonas thiooxydans]MDH1332959.1 aspartate dehydrogenase [Comamonas thiooxydans]MDH1475019.1 aspartate dehydrogenase [Comamonas thiooxydans]MDH1741341.1 aspartate dehydrogenase [Comamonas thiooxydans]MDH1785386.1 aspartate dehydrogenase [Comamonas thiooxydans]